MRIVVVTGTSTGVGKTVCTAALAAAAARAGVDVAMVKPAQTGTAEPEPTDAAVVSGLAGCPAIALVSLADPLAPDTAARLRGEQIPSVAELATGTSEALRGRELGLVEGSGGVAVRLDTAGGTLLDLGGALLRDGHDVRVVVVTTVALGTLNATELTVQAVGAAGLPLAGLVYGAMPASPGLAERCNVDELPRVTGLPVLAALPEGAGAEPPESFRRQAPDWLTHAGGALVTRTGTTAEPTAYQR